MSQTPPLPEKDLPPGRHRLLKEHLMTEIRYEEQAPVRTPVGKRNPWLRPALTAAAVATVAAVTFTLLPSSGDSGSGPRVTTAAAVLEDAALAAGHATQYDKIRDDQFTYVESQVSYTRVKNGKQTVVPPHRRETWLSVDGSRDGLIRDALNSRDTRWPGFQEKDHFYDSYPGYNHLKSLPTDPKAMYDWLRKSLPDSFGVVLAGVNAGLIEQDQGMLFSAGNLMQEGIMPSAQAAALFRAIARIPGVTVVEDAVDALGRHGVGIAREDAKQPFRMEWIFDRKTHQLLGQRTTLTRDFGGLKKGTVSTDSATVRRAVVDKAGQRP
ncbi:CU044_5270 family protein [Streptomyces sp. NPDC051677]|uniref:CU044_5270 family protein n=1 Tax=Streptomyces sp. NPDC051677 TaxID=3365669 RepID=UPI0037CD693B